MVYNTQELSLGHRLTLILGILVGFVVFGTLGLSLRRMSLDIIHNYFDEPFD